MRRLCERPSIGTSAVARSKSVVRLLDFFTDSLRSMRSAEQGVYSEDSPKCFPITERVPQCITTCRKYPYGTRLFNAFRPRAGNNREVK